eukprot:2373676-Lingulodinium_polyedra.AAC.1
MENNVCGMQMPAERTPENNCGARRRQTPALDRKPDAMLRHAGCPTPRPNTLLALSNRHAETLAPSHTCTPRATHCARHAKRNDARRRETTRNGARQREATRGDARRRETTRDNARRNETTRDDARKRREKTMRDDARQR